MDIIDGKNYYEILGVPTDATQKQIKIAYNKMLKKYYLDKKRTGQSDIYLADIETAYDVLKDAEQRSQYDKDVLNMVEEDETIETSQGKIRINKNGKSWFKKHKNTVIAVAAFCALTLGGTAFASTILGISKSQPSKQSFSTVQSSDEENANISDTPDEVEEVKALTAENIEEKVQEILLDNQSKGLNIDPTFIRSALFVTNIDYLDQEDIKKIYEKYDINMEEEVVNLYNYASAVGSHNNAIILGLKEGNYIALSNLAYDAQDRLILIELDTEFVDLVNGLNSDMTAQEFQQSFKYITEFYNGFGYLTTNGTDYSNYSLTSGGGLLSEMYWPMFSTIYRGSKYLTIENEADIHTLTYGNGGDGATLNGHKYLSAIYGHEALQCLEDNQELEQEKTLTKTR